MNNILLPSDGPDSWKRFLAQPELHWSTGFSARTLAHCWEAANGLPTEIDRLLRSAFGPVDLVLAIPEHKTPLPGGWRESQSDVFTVVRHAVGIVTCTIEGKVEEPFGPTVGEWLIDASPGKVQRLRFICELLGLPSCPPDVHYQLMHRTASALIEADRFAAGSAAMLVHSFSPSRRWFETFRRFAGLLGREPAPDESVSVAIPSGKELVLGWCCGDQKFLSM